MDYLHIKGLTVATRIGIHDWEQQIKQRLSIDLSIPYDMSQCQDQIENALDYDKLCSLITQIVETQSFKLIETVAETVASLVKNSFDVSQISVSVSKPNAIKNAKDILVSIVR